MKRLRKKDLEFIHRVLEMDERQIIKDSFRSRLRHGERWMGRAALQEVAEANGLSFEELVGRALGVDPDLLKRIDVSQAIAKYIGLRWQEVKEVAKPTYWTWVHGRWPRYPKLLAVAKHLGMDNATDMMRAAIQHAAQEQEASQNAA